MNAGFQIATAAFLSPGSGCGGLQLFATATLLFPGAVAVHGRQINVQQQQMDLLLLLI